MISKKNRLNFVFLFIAFVFIISCFSFVFIRNDRFNRKDRILNLSTLAEFPEKQSEISVLIEERGGESGNWATALSLEAFEKTGCPILMGNTFDVTIENKTAYEITDWNIAFTMDKLCYIESAWCGKVDIIQQRNGKTLAQNFNLRTYNSKMVKIDYVETNGQILFPLEKGDVFVYYPSLEEKEVPLMGTAPNKPKSFAKLGFILYGKDIVSADDLLHGELTFKCRKRINQDPAFLILVYISVIWAFSLVFLLLSEGRINEIEQIELRDKKMIQEVMETFSGFVDAKDPYTGGHSIRVGKYSKQLAEEMGLDKKQCQQVFYCGLLHDCGKISIHDDILSKPKRLTDDEFSIIKSHTIRGFEILSGLTAIPEACMVARYHHERYDGKGYPDGLAGNAIPLYARITCLADAFDAMNSNRCYRNHMGPDMIIKQISDNAGRQFDPDVADAMLRLLLRGEIVFPE